MHLNRTFSAGLRSALMVAVALLPMEAQAGGGELAAPANGDSYGRMKLNVNYRYPPTQDEVEELKGDLRMASRILCDASEGLVRIKDVTITAGAKGETTADAWMFDQNGRSNVPPFPLVETGFSARDGRHAEMFRDFRNGGVEASPHKHPSRVDVAPLLRSR